MYYAQCDLNNLLKSKLNNIHIIILYEAKPENTRIIR